MIVSTVHAQATAAPAAPQRLDLEPDLNRWRLLEPQGIGEKPRSPLYDPYTPNVTKGDIPIFGDKVFLATTGVLDFFTDLKRNLDFFSAGRFRNVPFHETNLLGQITGVLFLEVFQGDTVFTPKDWAVRVIRHVGNYGEVYDRNVGLGSDLGIPRGLNQLWNAGGILYAPPIR